MFAKTEPYYPNFSIAEALDSSPKMMDIRSRIDEGEIIIFRNFISQDKITNLKIIYIRSTILSSRVCPNRRRQKIIIE